MNKKKKVFFKTTMNLIVLVAIMLTTFLNSNCMEVNAAADPYVSLFWGSAWADAGWNQAVVVTTTKNNGGTFDASEVKENGYFYVEYKGTQDAVNLALQSWTNTEKWVDVQMSESGTANGNYFAKYSYDNCVAAFGSDFTGELDRVNVGSTGVAGIEVVSVCYCISSNTTGSDNTPDVEDGEASDGFYVSGTTVYDANGKPFVMRGVNVAHAFEKKVQRVYILKRNGKKNPLEYQWYWTGQFIRI